MFPQSTALGVLLTWLAVRAAAGGHGTYSLAKLFFPYSMVLAPLVGSIHPVLVLFALLQWPAYALTLAVPRQPSGQRRVLVTLLAIHCAALVVAFLVTPAGSDFTP